MTNYSDQYNLAYGGVITGNLEITGNLTIDGNLIFGDASTDVLTVVGYMQGSALGTTYLRVGSSTTSHSLAATNDLFVSGQLEVDGAAFFDSTISSFSQVFFSQTSTSIPTSFSSNSNTIVPEVNIARSNASANFTGLALWKNTDTGTRSNNLSFISSRNTSASPTALVTGDNAAIMQFYGYNGSDYETCASIQVVIDGTPTNSVGGSIPGQIFFNTQRDGAALGATTALSLNNNGDSVNTSRTNSVNLTASTEKIQFSFAGNATRTYATGALTLARCHLISPPSLAFAGASVVTVAATSAITALTTQGANATLTNNVGYMVGDPTATLWTITGTGTNMDFLASMPAISSGVTNVTEVCGYAFGNLGNSIPHGDTVGTTTNLFGGRFDAVTLTSTGTRTITNASTVKIAGPFTAGAGVTFTNQSLSLWVAAGATRLDGSQRRGVTTSSSATVTITTTDDTYILSSTRSSTGAQTVNLPAVATSSGRILKIKDAAGSAATNNITLDGNASETIDGATTFVMNTNYGSATIYCDGAAWFVI